MTGCLESAARDPACVLVGEDGVAQVTEELLKLTCAKAHEVGSLIVTHDSQLPFSANTCTDTDAQLSERRGPESVAGLFEQQRSSTELPYTRPTCVMRSALSNHLPVTAVRGRQRSYS